jgi:hypothetical protein
MALEVSTSMMVLKISKVFSACSERFSSWAASGKANDKSKADKRLFMGGTLIMLTGKGKAEFALRALAGQDG